VFDVFWGHPAICVCNFQVRVQKIHVDGVQRTKADIITQHVKDIFSASNFDEVCFVVVDTDERFTGLIDYMKLIEGSLPEQLEE